MAQALMEVKLKSSDGKIFIVSEDVARMIGKVRMKLDNPSDDDDHMQHDTVIPIDVKGKLLKMILQWAKYHQHDPPEEDCNGREKVLDVNDICAWDRKFLDVSHDRLLQLTMASHTLSVKGLQVLTCKTIAGLMIGKSAEEIKKAFKIGNGETKTTK